MNLSVIQRVFWKDWKQIQTPVLAIAGVLCAVQLFLLANVWFEWRLFTIDIMSAKSLAHYIILPVPLLVGAIVTATIIGQERSTRTWNWGSSMPIPWYVNICSHFTNYFLAMVITLLPMFALANVFPLHESAIPSYVDLFANLLLISMEMVIALSILMLLLNESVSLMLIGFAIFIGYELACVSFCPIVLSGKTTISQAFLGAFWGNLFRISRATILLLGLDVYLCIHRWRWTTGQDQRSLLSRFSLGNPAHSTGEQNWTVAIGTRQRRREWWVIVAEACRSYVPTHFTLIALVFLGAGAIALVILFNLVTVESAPITVAIAFGCLIFLVVPIAGITTFSVDQAKSRFRFLADRGVQPEWFALTRTTLTFFAVTLMMLMAWCLFHFSAYFLSSRPLIHPQFTLGVFLWRFLFPVLALSSVTAFSSFCFQRATTAFLASMLTILLGAIAFWSATSRSPLIPDPNELDLMHIVFWTPMNVVAIVTLVTMLIYILFGVRRWMIDYRFAGLQWFVAGCATTLIVSIAAAITFENNGW